MYVVEFCRVSFVPI